MPVRRRRQKRRISEAAELETFSMMFECGRDFFNELEDFGFDHDVRDGKHAAAREAWQRLGARFMEAWAPTAVREKPWALETFGEPRCR